MKRLMIISIVFMIPTFFSLVFLGMIALDLVCDLQLNIFNRFISDKLNTSFLTWIFALGAIGSIFTFWASITFLHYINDIDKLHQIGNELYQEKERYRKATDALVNVFKK